MLMIVLNFGDVVVVFLDLFELLYVDGEFGVLGSVVVWLVL